MGPCEQNQIAYARERFKVSGHTVFERPFALWGISHRTAGECLVTGCQMDDHYSQVEEIVRTFQAARRPGDWVLGPSAQPAELGRFLRTARRMMGPMHLAEMELDLADWSPEPLSLPVARIHEWDAIDAEGHPKLTWVSKASRIDTALAMKELQALGATHFFVSYVDGRLASCTAVFIHDGVAGIYDVITKEPYRRRGAASAAMTAALGFARDTGCRVAVLQSHRKAIGLYRRLGFEEKGLFKVFYYSTLRMEADAAAR